MADLSAGKREKLPAKDFGLPEKARTKDAKKKKYKDKCHQARRDFVPFVVSVDGLLACPRGNAAAQ